MDTTRWDAIAAALRSMQYPANRQDLLNHVRRLQVDPATLNTIAGLPVGIYRNLIDVRDRVRIEADS